MIGCLLGALIQKNFHLVLVFLLQLLDLVRWILDLPKDGCHSRCLWKLLCRAFTFRWLELSIASPLSVVHPRHGCFLESLLGGWAIALHQRRVVHVLTSWGTQIDLLATYPGRVQVMLVFLRLVYRSAVGHDVWVWILLVALIVFRWLLSSMKAASGAKRISELLNCIIARGL